MLSVRPLSFELKRFELLIRFDRCERKKKFSKISKRNLTKNFLYPFRSKFAIEKQQKRNSNKCIFFLDDEIVCRQICSTVVTLSLSIGKSFFFFLFWTMTKKTSTQSRKWAERKRTEWRVSNPLMKFLFVFKEIRWRICEQKLHKFDWIFIDEQQKETFLFLSRCRSFGIISFLQIAQGTFVIFDFSTFL